MRHESLYLTVIVEAADHIAKLTEVTDFRLSAGICKIGPFYATFFILLTAMNSTLVTACRLAFSSR